MDVLETALAVWIGTELIPLLIEGWWTILLFSVVMTISAIGAVVIHISAMVSYLNPWRWIRRYQSPSRSGLRQKGEET